MLRALALFTCLSLLPACVPGGAGGALARSGLSGTYTGQVVLTDEVHHVLIGHVVIARDDAGPTGRALVVAQRRDGVHALRVTGAAGIDGTDLHWHRLPHPADSCGPAHCRDRVLGLIPLSEAALAHAARFGLTARLASSVGPISIAAPPDLFQKALDPRAPQGI